MDWSNEQYVRLYIRDTKTWLKLQWEGQCLFMMLLRKVDRSGVLDDIDEPSEDLSLITGLPFAIVKTGVKRLVDMGTIKLHNGILVIPNFIDANETPKSDRLRAREHRERRKLEASGITIRDDRVTIRDETSRGVTRRHTASLYPVPHPKPVPNPNPRKSAPARLEYTKEFLQFWASYPRKKQKGDAFKAWQSAKKNGLPPTDELVQVVHIHAKTEGWKKENGQFIPYPASWLRSCSWEDEILEAKPKEINYGPGIDPANVR